MTNRLVFSLCCFLALFHCCKIVFSFLSQSIFLIATCSSPHISLAQILLLFGFWVYFQLFICWPFSLCGISRSALVGFYCFWDLSLDDLVIFAFSIEFYATRSATLFIHSLLFNAFGIALATCSVLFVGEWWASWSSCWMWRWLCNSLRVNGFCYLHFLASC